MAKVYNVLMLTEQRKKQFEAKKQFEKIYQIKANRKDIIPTINNPYLWHLE